MKNINKTKAPKFFKVSIFLSNQNLTFILLVGLLPKYWIEFGISEASLFKGFDLNTYHEPF